MGRRLTIVFFLLVMVPVATMALLGFRIWSHRAERDAAERTTQYVERLEELETLISATMEVVESRLLERLGQVETTPHALRTLRRREPLLAQVFMLNPNGQVDFPPDADASRTEREFLEQTRAIWSGDAILYEPPASEETEDPIAQRSRLWFQ